jgi:hypothetical protein
MQSVEWGEKARKQTDLQKYSLLFDIEGFCTHPDTSVIMVIRSIGLLDLILLDLYLWGLTNPRRTSKQCKT